MSSTPFRFVQRRTTISGRVPVISSLLTGEIYLQTADGTIYFRDAHQDKLHTVITDASGFGLNKLKFSGAVSGDIPLWDGAKIIPYNTGSFDFGSGSSTVGVLGSGYGLNSIQQSGSNNYSSGNYSVTIGSGNSANEDFSFALGKDAKTSNFGEFAFSNGSFSEKGDSQYSFVMGRVITTNSTPTKILINNSDKIVELDLGSTVFFTANVVGAGDGKYISNEIRGVIKRSQNTNSEISFINSPSKSIFALSPSNSNFSVNVSVSTSDNSLKIECIGDSTEEMIWFAKVDLITIKKTIVQQYPPIYFQGSNNDYYDLNNWFRDSSFTIPSIFIPTFNSSVIMSGNNLTYINIDNSYWVTPHIINTLNITNPSGVVLTSTTGKIFTGVIIGNSTFSGAIPSYAYDLNSFTANEISQLPIEYISSLTLGQISSLSIETINALTPQQLAALSPEQLAALTNLQIQGLFESNIAGYSTPINLVNSNESFSSLTFPPSEIVNLINYTLNNTSANYLTIDATSEP